MNKILSLTKVLYKANKNNSGKMKKSTKYICGLLIAGYLFFIFSSFWSLMIKPLNEIPNPPHKECLKVTYVNVSEYYNGTNVGNYVFDYMYYMNIIVPLIKSGLGIKHPEGCTCGHCE